jgi:hypothetical protein
MNIEHRTSNIECGMMSDALARSALRIPFNIRCSMLNVRCSAFALLTLAALTGCHPPTPTTPPTPQSPAMHSPLMLTQKGSALLTSTIQSAAESPMGLQVEVYQLQVPEGTISRNEKFWKRVDEQCIDPGTYDLLYKNGVRVGIAPNSDWDHFREIMKQYPAVTKVSTLVATQNKPVEMSMRKDIPAQDIFYFNAANALEGRSYDGAENLINLTFQQAPRGQGTMRVALCPVIRSVKKRLEFSPLNNEVELTYTAPERLYDLNLHADVPPESFMIVGPSEESSTQTSIGNHFFITEGHAERLENVLIIIPKTMRIEETPLAIQPTKKK